MGEEGGKMPTTNVHSSAGSEGDVSHQIISSLFLGPQAENIDYFKENIMKILDANAASRKSYQPGDGVRTVASKFSLDPAQHGFFAS